MTSKRCKDWCDTFASAYPVKSYCSDECKAAGRSINEKDKPEAGRTCKPWCGLPYRDRRVPTDAVIVPGQRTQDPAYCSKLCLDAAKCSACDGSGRVEIRTVEPSTEVCPSCRGDGGVCQCGAPGGYCNCPPCATCEGRGTAEREESPDDEPGPVERCSCEEATRYKAALERIRDYSDSPKAYDIARRALALGGGNDNG